MTVRGFPAFPAGAGRARPARGRWAAAWRRAVEEIALDPQPLRAGRRHATRGHVGPITVSAGRVAAHVHDGDPELAHHAVVRVTPWGDADWARFAAAATGRAGHLAALLARQVPADLVDAAGLRLVPGLGELTPECDCPDWDHPCRHAAALCHQVSWLLDADPALLLLIRGRDLADVLAGLRDTPPAPAGAATAASGGAAAGGGAGADRAGGGIREEPTGAGEDPAVVYARAVPSLPAPPGPPEAVTLPLLPPGPGVDPEALHRLAAGAATHARALLRARGTPPSGPAG